MGKVVSMINWKGGVGKSTLTLHIGCGISDIDHDAKILLIDLDPQCNLSFLALGVTKYINLAYNNNQATLKEMFDAYFSSSKFDIASSIIKMQIPHSPGYVWSNVDLILSHQELVLIDLRLARERRTGSSHKEETKFELDKLSILNNALSNIINEYDYIILDCPPNINLVTQNAFFASTNYIIPAIPDFLSTVGISLIKDKMLDFNRDFDSMIQYSGAKRTYTPTEFSGIIFNMVDEYALKPKDTHLKTIQSVAAQHPGMPFSHYITDGDGISVAAENNYTAYAYKHLPKSQQNAHKQSDYLINVVKEFMTRIPK